MVTAGLGLSGVRLAADETDDSLGIDTDFFTAWAAVGEVVKSGDKEAAEAAMQALWERVVPPLAAAHARAADLQLASFNSWDPATADEIEAEFGPLRKEIARLTKNNALLRIERADRLETLGKAPGEDVVLAGKIYSIVKQQQTMLSMRGIVNLSVAKQGEAEQVSARELSEQLEAAAATTDGDAREQLKALVREFGPALGGDSELLKQADDFADTVGILMSILQDHVTAIEALDHGLTICPGSADLWAQRSQARLSIGDARGAFHDLLIANALNSDSKVVETVGKVFVATPRDVAQVYLEPVNNGRLAQVAMAVSFGGTPKGEDDLIVAAARRNFGRRIFAASLLKDAEERRAALAWVVANCSENATFPCQAIRDTLAVWDQENADAGESVRQILAVHNRHIGVLGGVAAFWKIRYKLMVGIDRNEDAQAALDVAKALEPEADWLDEAQAMLDKS